MKKFKNPLLFALCLLPFAFVGGYFSSAYLFEISSREVINATLEKTGGSMILANIITAITTSVYYALILGFLGYILSEKVGLMKPLRFEKKPLTATLITSLVFGILICLDYPIFGTLIPELKESFYNITPAYFIASLTYGGVIEEVIMRLFVMSLIAFIIMKLKKQNADTVSDGVIITANVIAALLFAAGHLPTTFNSFEHVGALLIFRCFLLNGGYGLLFGRLYRKYGIQYAMLCHAGVHLVSKLILMVML